MNGNILAKRVAKISRGASPTLEDMAMYAMMKLHTATSDVMQVTRRYFPNELFLQVGYLFEDWTTYPEITVDKSTLEMYWAVPSSEYKRPNFDEVIIPECVTSVRNPEEVDNKNESILKEFAENRPELELIVQHDVWVRKNGRMSDQRNHPGDDLRVFRRIVNLMDVAGFIYRTTCGFPIRSLAS